MVWKLAGLFWVHPAVFLLPHPGGNSHLLVALTAADQVFSRPCHLHFSADLLLAHQVFYHPLEAPLVSFLHHHHFQVYHAKYQQYSFLTFLP
jgi:hypothetical protein